MMIQRISTQRTKWACFVVIMDYVARFEIDRKYLPLGESNDVLGPTIVTVEILFSIGKK